MKQTTTMEQTEYTMKKDIKKDNTFTMVLLEH